MVKTRGMVRKVDDLGRIIIPSPLRKRFELNGQSVEIFLDDDDNLVVQKFAGKCVFCGAREQLVTYHEKILCSGCIGELTNRRGAESLPGGVL